MTLERNEFIKLEHKSGAHNDVYVDYCELCQDERAEYMFNQEFGGEK